MYAQQSFADHAAPQHVEPEDSHVDLFTREFLGGDLDDFPDDEIVLSAARERHPHERAAWAAVAALAGVLMLVVLV